ncbi:2-isopropylmalate synthase [Pichia kluyveri]|uniref:2-isopropylmalate synthase n=1 Tax=Pichia kluyveri TaxID=36015 RepID=A0AAV5R5G3_PICKL|nr:2-isopropylmalate synthase [Pichia kluyveri]
MAFRQSMVMLKEVSRLAYKNMLRDPSVKYSRTKAIKLHDRTWPDKVIDKAPRWLSTDLRDGNQSLPDPMSVEQKKEYFHKLLEIGFKEIEVSFPSASQTDFDFTRYAVENCPKDVAIQCLVQSREHLIRRTVDALKGAPTAIVHTYLATSDLFRDVVFKMSQEEAIEKAVETAKFVRSLTKDDPTLQDTKWVYQFSPECFSDTPSDFALKICEAVKEAWEPTVDNPIIFNLPATVEVASPNVYADQVEYFCRNISEREKVVVSLHCHNDRGSGVAAIELGLLAGGDRVEGCLFGNGERTGNVDLTTLALNMYTEGVSPELDFSDIQSIIDVVEKGNKIPIHERAPYGGSLVVCAFSGSHQDAIKKGFIEHEKRVANGDKRWMMPYLPLDPKDIGRSYEAVIRVNSQSGKGGAAWIVQRAIGLDLPRQLQILFSKVVQDKADSLGRELKSDEIVELLTETYNIDSKVNNSLKLAEYKYDKVSEEVTKVYGIIEVNGEKINISGTGNGPISSLLDAFGNAFKTELEVEEYSEHALGSGSKTKAASFLKISCNDKTQWGIGTHESVTKSTVNSILSVVNSLLSKNIISK